MADPRRRAAEIARSLGLEPNTDDWAPTVAQSRFLSLGCFEALYGGAAGGGKSDALLAAAAQGIGQGFGRGYQALLLRRTFPELETSLVRRSRELYPRIGGRFHEQRRTWTFPGGESVLFGHLEHEHDVHRYQGSAFQFVGFDELTTFTEYQYVYLFSRTRSASGVPCRVRAASNPGGIGHEWVRSRWLQWVSRKATKPARPSEVRWYARRGDSDVEVARGEHGALGRTFVPAFLQDNPFLAIGDPAYRARLEAMPRIERLRLLGGDWDARPASKDYWDRARIRVLTDLPLDALTRARAWDFSASDDGDWIVGARTSWTESGLFVVEHVARFRGSPDVLHANFDAVTQVDAERFPSCLQVIPQDPGAAGKIVVADFMRRYPNIALAVVRPTGEKRTRFLPVSSRGLAGGVAVVDDGSWDVSALHDELEALWAGQFDDQADALSDAFAICTAPMDDDDDAIVVPHTR